MKNLSEAEHLLVSAAVSKAEETSNGEIVTIAAAQSDDYKDVALIWAAIGAFIAMSFTAFFPVPYLNFLNYLLGGWGSDIRYSEFAWLISTIAALKFIAIWLLMKWQPLLMALTPPWIKSMRSRQRAIELFRVGTESKTLGKTGILIYLSMAEHRAEIVADAAITQLVGAEKWGDAMEVLIKNAKAGNAGQGIAEAVEQIGIILKQHFPKCDDDFNELPDKLIEL